ncbi:MAG: bifunctional diaminohydroxyphosphoribosylaminopyrimidine deaminase/5-amino-6-(5-phosphoribosylamino)uracil reductase RibD [Nevskiales bacterium]|nr:bifunctional diaminohydroxyphosphoribosylaminopyrimidine deaminase/5-amino-6-(5-phosphoribosylamino)uracil reductase RibD [Nevskiales bacterium]
MSRRSDSRSPDPAAFMARALRLAERGCGTTHPNPRVGCVIVKAGEVVGEGFHERAGGPHAEAVALQHAGDRAQGAEAYLTLEPCCHHGRTPPCAEALIRAGVKRVVAAMEDPNPKVAGQGLEALRQAGIEVELGLMAVEAAQLNRGFVSRMTRGRPWVTLKLAMSLDGRTAMAGGESRWITGEEARADVHRLRAEAGAVLTSVNTVLADNPELSVRLPSPVFRPPSPDSGPPSCRQPDRIVLDTQLRASATARVWAAGARRMAIAVRPPADRMEGLRKQGVEVVLVETTPEHRVDLMAALDALGRLEINEVLVECGPTLAGALLHAGRVDELVVYAAPSLLGHEARALAYLPGLDSLDRRLRLRFVDVRPVGADLRLILRPDSP